MKRDWVPLYGDIRTSEKLASLPDDTCRLGYTWLLTLADQWGRIPAKPKALCAQLWPMLGKDVTEMARVLSELAIAKLVQSGFTSDAEPWIEIAGWEEKAGRHIPPNRRGPIPEPMSASAPPAPPLEEKRREERWVANPPPTRTPPTRKSPEGRSGPGPIQDRYYGLTPRTYVSKKWDAYFEAVASGNEDLRRQRKFEARQAESEEGFPPKDLELDPRSKPAKSAG